MIVARTTEGWAPTTKANPTTTAMATTAVGRRPMPTKVNDTKTAEARMATLKPDTASTW